MKKRTKWFLGGFVGAVVVLQFIHPIQLDSPDAGGHDFLATSPPPPEIAALLRGACYDCHSDETQWPWYGRIAPVSWWMTDHVNDARKRLNFSEWPQDDPHRAAKNMERISESVEAGEMPLPSYALIHGPARLNPGQRNLLTQWSAQEAQRLRTASAQ
jgi:hypothetical protein